MDTNGITEALAAIRSAQPKDLFESMYNFMVKITKASEAEVIAAYRASMLCGIAAEDRTDEVDQKMLSQILETCVDRMLVLVRQENTRTGLSSSGDRFKECFHRITDNPRLR